jgi:hypothetical protein
VIIGPSKFSSQGGFSPKDSQLLVYHENLDRVLAKSKKHTVISRKIVVRVRPEDMGSGVSKSKNSSDK